jgi:hypothetical protein
MIHSLSLEREDDAFWLKRDFTAESFDARVAVSYFHRILFRHELICIMYFALERPPNGILTMFYVYFEPARVLCYAACACEYQVFSGANQAVL